MHARTTVILTGTFTLVSCIAQESALAPEIVLQRSSQANRGLQTVEVHAFMLTKDKENDEKARLSLQGQLQHAGTELFAHITIDTQGESTTMFHMIILQDGSILITEPRQTTANTPYSTQSIETEEWIPLIPPTHQQAVEQFPLLDIQKQGIHITKDRGISLLRNKKHYSYATVMDNRFGEEFVIRGELWVDIHTFFTSRIVWNIEKEQQQHATLNIDVFSHNTVPPFSVPKHIRTISEEERQKLLERILTITPPFLQTLLEAKPL